MRMRGALLLSIMLAFLAAFAACKGGGDEAGGAGQQITRERDGVRLKLSLDKAKYGPEDPVRVKLTIENTNDTPVTYQGKTPNAPGLTISVFSDLAGDQPLGQRTPEDISGTLAGGAKLQREVEWDKQVQMSLTPVTAPPGQYTITAKFLMARAGFADLIELSGAVTFEVEGTPYVQPVIDALRAMVADERVKAWAQGRDDTIICAYPPRGLFYNGSFSTGAAAETFDFLYKSQTENGLPICGIATDGDAWRFVLFSAKGDEPKRLTVHVKLDEPVVLSVQEGGPTPAPEPTPTP